MYMCVRVCMQGLLQVWNDMIKNPVMIALHKLPGAQYILPVSTYVVHRSTRRSYIVQSVLYTQVNTCVHVFMHARTHTHTHAQY